MQEVYKDIPGFDIKYQASNLGNIKSVNSRNRGKDIILFQIKSRAYPSVGLTINGKRKFYSVHRLVALTFLPNPENKPQVNHIDGDKQNSNLDNLEWVTVSENVKHSYRVLGQKPTKFWTGKFGKDNKNSKIINQYTKLGEFVSQYIGITESGRKTGIERKNISSCCLGKLKSAGGFVWKYAQ